MKITILIVALLASFIGVCCAEENSSCFERCISQNNNASPSDISYCKESCSRTQEEYPSQSLELTKQQLEIQKQSLEIQKQQLELQKQLLEQAKQNTSKPAE
ncbi:MAG: hypothetical protein WCX16_00180 [Candidatus Omnitrophota bacterium]|jgi:hypothetical protein